MLQSMRALLKKALFGLTVVAAAGLQAHGDEPRANKAVTKAGEAGPLLDVSKGKVERPAKALVAASTPNRPKEGETNPKVEPGKVKWHSSFQTACEASKKTGRPVLLFQMLGNLNEEFC